MEKSAPSPVPVPRRASLVRRAGVLLVGILLLVLLAAGGWRWFRVRSSSSFLAQAQRALERGHLDDAERLAGQVHEGSAQAQDAWLVVGTVALQRGRLADALEFLDCIPDNGSAAAVEARALSGDILLNGLFRPTDAERHLRRAIAQNPRHLEANRHLGYLLGLCGRSFEAAPFRLELIRQSVFTPTELLLLALRDTARENAEVVAELARRSPDDPLVQLGQAIVVLGPGELVEAERLVRSAIAQAPELVEGYARLGRLLLETGRLSEFEALSRTLPAAAEGHPEIWALRGDAARERGDLRAAARCFWEAIGRDPTHQRACYQLSQTLLALKDPERAAPFTRRAMLLQELLIVIKRRRSVPPEVTAQEAAEVCEKLGMNWEAAGWLQLALQGDSHLEVARRSLVRLEASLRSDLPRTVSAVDPALQISLADFPLPQAADSARSPPRTHVSRPGPVIRFADDATKAGLQFTYFNGADPAQGGRRVFEFTGGGVAVLDYDGDGWPDIYFTQGAERPQKTQSRKYTDRLFRNLGNGRFDDVTERSGLAEDRYSQGVTVGDFNSDGHPDLYVANLDGNRLYRNNGDGTFDDVTPSSGTRGDRWTTSCLLADLSGDGLPDLYAVNYLAGKDLFERVCRTAQGKPTICTPHDFQAALDQFFLNLGDGRFEEQTEATGFSVATGKGLGIVAADFRGTGQLSLFVANDTDGNFLFVNETASRGGPPLFREQAVVSGLAYNREGRTQACMGVAAGDANEDGLLDLFVTNYFEESATLYLQQAGELFVDATREAGLREPTLPMLGFGTQFLDADLDGLPDLVLTNGHVEDFRSDGTPYHMRPQCFRNRGAGRFEELAADSLGPYFQGEYLGRGLARLDWNRDGRPDFVVTHLDRPAALLTNQTDPAGHFFALHLRGVASSRDAIGATVQVRCGTRTQFQQLTAGDGYQSSNQRELIFGLGNSESIDEVLIRWPSGLAQEFRSPAIDAELLAIEGEEQLIRCPNQAQEVN